MGIFSHLIDIIRRNPFTTLFIVLLLVAAPQLLGVLALIILVPIIILIVGAAIMLVRLRKVQRDMHDAQSRGGYTGPNPSDTKTDGKVTVHIPHTEPKVSEDVGEYVDFKEE